MKKYLDITIFIILLLGIIFSLMTANKWKSKYITCQENSNPNIEYVVVHDTVSIDKPIIKWRTAHDTTEFVIRDTFYHNDTITIIQTEKMCLDSFSVDEKVIDNNIDATIHVQGRGIYNNTYIDTIGLEYKFIKQEIQTKENRCWLKRLFSK